MLERISFSLAANIRRRREARGLTQQELAELSGVPRPTIANLESGSANPTLLVLLKIADALGSKIEELVGDAGDSPVVHRASTLVERRRSGATIRRLLPDASRPVDFERIELSANSKFSARAEPAGGREILACETGEVEITAGGRPVRIAAGDVLLLAADQPRDLENRTKRGAVLYRIATERDG